MINYLYQQITMTKLYLTKWDVISIETVEFSDDDRRVCKHSWFYCLRFKLRDWTNHSNYYREKKEYAIAYKKLKNATAENAIEFTL